MTQKNNQNNNHMQLQKINNQDSPLSLTNNINTDNNNLLIGNKRPLQAIQHSLLTPKYITEQEKIYHIKINVLNFVVM